MKTKVIQHDPAEARTSPAAASQPAAQRFERRMTGGRIALLTIGVVAALLSLAALAGGALLLIGNQTERDAAGYFSTASHAFRTDSHAIVSENLDVGTDGPDWLFQEGRLATIRVRGSNADAGRELFIGVARTADVRRYLAGTRYTTLTEFDIDPFRTTYRVSAGASAPPEPGSQGFWRASTEGAGTQTLDWDVSKGDWSFLVMNADASPGVRADLSLAAKVPFILSLGLGLVIAGAVLLAGGGVTLYVGTRRAARAHPAAPVSAAA